MLSAISEFLVSLTYPPFLSLCLLLCAAAAVALRWRRSGKILAALAIAWSSLWSIPQCAQWLRAPLELRYPQIEANALPRADAIVVLGGGSYAWLRRAEIRLEDLKNSRLATGARAWLAGRAPVVVLSGGRGGNGTSEAALMATAMARIGVPASALMLEERSRDTRDNALFTAQLAGQHDIRRVLLVTSAVHMPRASYWFRAAGLDVVPVPVPEPRIRGSWTRRWLPSRDALWRSGRAWKEYAGLLEAHLETAFKGLPPHDSPQP
ncbi:YdcF family protein [Luteimonas sp. 22616]|uniref:YdcF family protein n=1 Tax=Luteimonas sp. 22616 TaxID=3453951 RepID=UPI003F83806A